MPLQLYLDSRDLIELVARNKPKPVAELAQLLRSANWVLVYSYPNICETVTPENLEETVRRARFLQSLPHSFIRAMPAIHCMELAEAIRAFETDTAPRRIDPFVTHWWETFLYPDQDRSMSRLARLTLEEQVVAMVQQNPDVCRNLPDHTEQVQQAVDEDRGVTDAVRRNRERFEGGLASTIARCGLRIPEGRRRDFSRWIREEAGRLPSWRLFDEGYLKFAANVTDAVDHGDASDWSHVSSLPYVDAITLDRRIAGYVRAAIANLTGNGSYGSCAYGTKIFANAEAWLRACDT